MFDINNIQYNQTTQQYTCYCQCKSSSEAQCISAKYVMIPKSFDVVGEIYHRGSNIIIGTSNKKAAINIASYINANYFAPSLDVFVFYGTSQKGLPSRWCVGFDFPREQAKELINYLNTQGPLVIADKNPQYWHDKNGKLYSTVMLTGVMEHEPSEELIQ